MSFPYLLLILAGSLAVEAQDFCSLTLEVVSPKNEKLSDVLVGIHEQNGRQDAKYTKDGIVQFCGLGLSGVTIVVGALEACEVTIKRGYLPWEVPLELKVVYDHGPCKPSVIPDIAYGVTLRQGTVPVLHCRTLLRFFDQEGHRIPGVTVNASSSDQYGRLMLSYRSNEDLHPAFAKEGFVTEKVDLRCTQEGSLNEQIITLRKVQ